MRVIGRRGGKNKATLRTLHPQPKGETDEQRNDPRY
jgi:hypothetical protein